MGPPPKKRRLTWLWILIPVLLVFVASAVVVVVFAVKLFIGPVDATNDYYADVSTGQYSSAYGRLCSLWQARYTEDQWVTRLQEEERSLGRITSTSFDTSEFQDGYAVVQGTLSRTGSGPDRVEVRLDREGDEWKLCGFRSW